MRERLPAPLRRALRPRSFGLRGRSGPVSERWGWDRGTPIDRWYIERFLADHGADIRGRVLEVRDSGYVGRFGSGVDRVDVLDVDAENPDATVVADLAAADVIADGAYDCFVLTQTLQYVLRLPDAVRHARRILAPGGVLLATVPSLSRVVLGKPMLADHWRLTQTSAAALFEDVFGPERVDVTVFGNAFSGAAFLLGYAAEELSARERDSVDPRFPVVVAIRAVR